MGRAEKGPPKRWLRYHDVWARDYWAGSLPEVHAYIAEFQTHHPIYTEAGVVMLGGWPDEFPDGDWAWKMNKALLIATLDGEPYLEVYDSGKALSGHLRIT